MKKLAIIGASYLQRPLVETALAMGIETHVFAWQEGNEVEDIADYYYSISILDREDILKVCQKIEINGIVSIGSDIAMPTVNYIADKMGLIGNPLQATLISTDKFEMRKALQEGGIECPYFEFYETPEFSFSPKFTFPVIVKPTDRSGSRGVTKVETENKVNAAIAKALRNSINSRAIVEDFIIGRELSVEMISYKGKHHFLAVTDKITTGPPYFVEIEHHQPANIPNYIKRKIIDTVKRSLNILKIKNGASHSEILLTSTGDIMVVEIAGRMGGDLIGSDMVKLSTGYDFVKGVIEIALGEFTKVDYSSFNKEYSGVYFVLPEPGTIKNIVDNSNSYKGIVRAKAILREGDKVEKIVDGAGKRAGVFVYHDNTRRLYFKPTEVLVFLIE